MGFGGGSGALAAQSAGRFRTCVRFPKPAADPQSCRHGTNKTKNQKQLVKSIKQSCIFGYLGLFWVSKMIENVKKKHQILDFQHFCQNPVENRYKNAMFGIGSKRLKNAMFEPQERAERTRANFCGSVCTNRCFRSTHGDYFHARFNDLL